MLLLLLLLLHSALADKLPAHRNFDTPPGELYWCLEVCKLSCHRMIAWNHNSAAAYTLSQLLAANFPYMWDWPTPALVGVGQGKGREKGWDSGRRRRPEPLLWGERLSCIARDQRLFWPSKG
jgi:hypothetical protein